MFPVCADDDHDFKTITAGNAHTCALTADGTAYCWGANDLGELGNGITVNVSVPTRVTTHNAHLSVLRPVYDLY